MNSLMHLMLNLLCHQHWFNNVAKLNPNHSFKIRMDEEMANLSDEEATILMVDSNLQREKLLPSEKEFAYKMKLDAMKRQAGIRRASGRKSRLNPSIYPFNKLGLERIKSNEMLKIENKYTI